MRASEHEQTIGTSEPAAPERPEEPAPSSSQRFTSGGHLPPVLHGFADMIASASDRAFGTVKDNRHETDGIKRGTPGPKPGEAPEVAAARDLLTEAEGRTDQDLLIATIKKILEAAQAAAPEVGEQLVELLRAGPYPQQFPAVANALGDAARVIEQRKHPHPKANANDGVVPPAIEASAPASFDWTKLLQHGRDGMAAGALTDEDRAKLKQIAAHRKAALPGLLAQMGGDFKLEGKGRDWVPDGHGNFGWQHNGNKSLAQVPPQQDRIVRLGAEELFTGESIEAYFNGVVTYDGTVSIGSGWANFPQGGEAGQYLERWMKSDPAARTALLEMGFGVAADSSFAVVDDSGNLLGAKAAHDWLKVQEHGSVLAYLSRLMEQGDSPQKAMAAQVSILKDNKIEKLKQNGVYDAMQSWPDNSVKAAIHLGNWDLIAAPWHTDNVAADYIATHGNPLLLLHAFAKNMRSHIGHHGALILGSSATTADPMAGHLNRWAGHVLSDAVHAHTAKPPISATFVEAGKQFPGHVLVLLEGPDKDTHEYKLADLGALAI